MFKNILLATDGYISTEKAVCAAIRFAKNFAARLHIISIIDITSFANLPTNVFEELENTAKSAIERIANCIEERDIKIEIIKEISIGNPGIEIIKYAKNNSIDIIIMGTTQKNILSRFVLGSVAEDVVRRSKMPVLIIPK